MTRRSRLWLARRRSPSAAQGKTTTIVHSPPAPIAPPAIGPEPLDADGQFDETGNADPDASLGVRLGYRVSYDPNTDSLEHVVFFPLHGNPATAQYATCLPLGMYRLRRSLCLRRDRHFVPKQTVVNQIPPQLRWYIDLE
jgi:hypothetical protein